MTVSRIQHAIHISDLGDMSLARKLAYAQTLEAAIEMQYPQANVSVYLTRNIDLIENDHTTRIVAENENIATELIIKSIQGIADRLAAKHQLPDRQKPEPSDFLAHSHAV